MPNASTVFVDTNVLIYAADGRPESAAKKKRAIDLLATESVCLSYQVLQEFYANTVHPRKLKLPQAEAERWCEGWLQYPVAEVGAGTFVHALELIRRYQISNWDAGILAAAQQFGCTTLYTEDLNHGQTYDGVQVVNPFLGL
jgi:predicted nucleic acid-binding protein